jgi:hypothetical protein
MTLARRRSGRRQRGGAGVVAGHQHVHVAAAGLGGRHGVQGGALDRSVVVFCNNESGPVLDHLGFVLELVDQGGHVGHLDASAALGGSATFRS